jgi:hypothetical protein
MDDRSHPNIKIGALKKCIKSDVHFLISSKSNNKVETFNGQLVETFTDTKI